MAIRLTVRHPSGHDLTELTFDQQRVRIGRGTGCDLRIPHPTVSVEHAMVLLEGDRYYLVDVGSANGTTLGGGVIVFQRRKLLRSGDVIGVADFEIEFRAGVPMLSHHSQDRTAAAARNLAQGMLAGDEKLGRSSLVVANGPQAGQRFALADPPSTMTVGRALESDITLVDGEVSRRHLELEILAEGVFVKDLGGRNPLKINERPVTAQRLHDRDELLVGSTTLIFDDPVEAYIQELARLPEEATGPIPTIERPGAEDHQAPKTRRESVDDALAGGEVAEAGPAAAGGSTRPTPAVAGPRREDHPADDNEITAPPPPSHGRSAPEAPAEPSAPRPFGLSAGSEIAILFVGLLALAACVAALVWIFR